MCEVFCWFWLWFIWVMRLVFCFLAVVVFGCVSFVLVFILFFGCIGFLVFARF